MVKTINKQLTTDSPRFSRGLNKIRKLEFINAYLYVGMLILSIIFLIFVSDKLIKVKDKVIKTKTEMARLDNDLSRLDSIIKQGKENEEMLSSLNDSLPSTYRDVAKFTVEIEEIARNEAETLDVAIDKITKDEESVNSLSFTITTQGNYTSIKNTLSQIANLPYHTSVDSLRVESNASGLVTLTNFRLLMQK